MTKARASLLVLFVAVGAYANSVGNGFALDDFQIVPMNPAVTDPSVAAVVDGPYWPSSREGSGLYRPVVIAGLALEWAVFGGRAAGFHAVNVVAHAGVSVLTLLLLAELASVGAALLGALLFAVHPVHVEAVANVVGQAELYAAAAVLIACYVYWTGADWPDWARGLRLLAVSALYALGLGAKEIAVTLPGLLVVLEAGRSGHASLSRRLTREVPLFVCLAAVLVTYVIVRTAVLGTTIGEVPAPALQGLSSTERTLTALTAWPEYVRLLIFPLDLASDYSPAVLVTVTAVGPDVLAGLLVIMGLLALTWVLRRRVPLASLGIVWFCVAILPVSNLLVPAGVILAERTLYLPSVGLAFVAAGCAARWPEGASRRARRGALALCLLVGSLFTIRTVLRNPTWFDTFTVLNTLAVEHPESFMSLKSRAEGLTRVGDLEGAAAAYEAALALAPTHYGLAVGAAEFFGSHGDYARAQELLERTARTTPDLPEAYFLLSEYLIRSGRAREGHAAALRGLASVGAEPRLFAVLSESYVAKGDLEAAARARVAALGQAPDSRSGWLRLGELYEALDRPADARAARERAAELTSA